MTSEDPAAALDWPRIEQWAQEIAAGKATSLRQAFAAQGARGPVLHWQPVAQALSAQQHRFLLRYWDDLRGDRKLPAGSEIDAVEMRPALGYINLLDAIDDGRDFRYRVFGSVIAAVSGFDMTGQLASSLKASPYMTEFSVAALRAAYRRGEPLYTEHGPPTSVYTATWHRLLLPLAGADGGVTRVLIGMVPMTHDGKPVAPRL